MRLTVLPLIAACLFLPACWLETFVRPQSLCRAPETSIGRLEIGGADFTGNVTFSRADMDKSSNQPMVQLKFDANGTARFGKLTEQRIGDVLPIVVDGVVLSSPLVQSAIPNGEVMISGSFSIQEAQELALKLAPPCS